MSVLQAEQVELQAGHQQPQISTVAGEDEEDFLNWKPGREELIILACLAIVSLVVALDGTVLVPVLPVGSHSNTLASFVSDN